MSDSKSNNNWFASALTLLFIALKLTGYIKWSWWWVLSPMWITVLFILLVLLIGLIGVFFGSDSKKIWKK